VSRRDAFCHADAFAVPALAPIGKGQEKEAAMTDHPELPPAAQRALAEAEERRMVVPSPGPKELGGRDGPEPVRYGDWEKKGLAIDF
jgi:hypothetical protein